jgi:hypothetical protein
VAIIVVASWPLLVTFAAFVGWPALTATVALLPLVASVAGLVAFLDPLVIGAIGAVWPKFLKAAALVVGTELAFGVYFTIVPVANDRALIPLALLLMLTIAFIAMSGAGVKRVMSALVTSLVILTIVFALGGRNETKEKYEDAKATVTEWATPAPRTVTTTTSGSASPNLMVGDRWTEVRIPTHHWFQLDPEKRIRVRLRNGQEFEKTPDGQWFNARGEPVSQLPDVIPGLSLDLRSADNTPTQVVFTTWPKK